MSIGLDRLKEYGASSLVASELGTEWLEEHPEFVDIAQQMVIDKTPEDILHEYGSYIGAGMYSDIRSFGGAAIKISSPTTGKKIFRYGTRGKPEQLVNQFLFLSALGKRLDTLPQSTITTPAQYLAFRTAFGNYVRIEQHMADWITVPQYNASSDWHFSEKENEVNATVKNRLKRELRDPLLRIGLNDLGLEKREPLHSSNVMIPATTEDIESAPLCIIDQPGRYHGYLGKLSIFLTSLSTAPEAELQSV